MSGAQPVGRNEMPIRQAPCHTRGSIPTTSSLRVLPITFRWPVRVAYRGLVAVVCFALLLLAARPVVPAYMAMQRASIIASAQRHGLSSDVLAAVLYNEMLGQEDRFLNAVLPGENPVAQTLRDSLLGWHFLTLKQVQWAAKGVVALAGGNTTVGTTGIRVSVGREIRSEVYVAGGQYRPNGLAERPSLVLDLTMPATATEYLAANLERGLKRAGAAQAGDWTAWARWHNTGLVADRPDVPRRVWDKGTNYVARVRSFLPEMTMLLNDAVSPPVWRAMLPGPRATGIQWPFYTAPRVAQSLIVKVNAQ